MTIELTLESQSPGISRVLTGAGLHVGNLKLIGDVWKFKAIGYNAAGDVVPGGGPFTEKHNAVVSALDAQMLSRALS